MEYIFIIILFEKYKCFDTPIFYRKNEPTLQRVCATNIKPRIHDSGYKLINGTHLSVYRTTNLRWFYAIYTSGGASFYCTRMKFTVGCF